QVSVCKSRMPPSPHPSPPRGRGCRRRVRGRLRPKVRELCRRLPTLHLPPSGNGRPHPKISFVICFRVHSDEFQSPGREEHHAQQQPSMTPTLDVRLPVRASAITDWQINQTQIQLRRAENQIEI